MSLAQWKTVKIKNECTNGAIKWTRVAEEGTGRLQLLGEIKAEATYTS
jgi:hypothetical protein